jgi:hypothetical protein
MEQVKGMISSQKGTIPQPVLKHFNKAHKKFFYNKVISGKISDSRCDEDIQLQQEYIYSKILFMKI